MDRLFTTRRMKGLSLGILLLVLSALVTFVADETSVEAFAVVLEIAALGLLVAAGGCAAYVGASIANEDHDELEHDKDGRIGRRRTARLEGTSLMPNSVVPVVRAGAQTPEEVAEVLGLYTHVARARCAMLVANGDLIEDEHGYLTAAVQAGGKRPSVKPARVTPEA